jgi:hypothetical protein
MTALQICPNTVMLDISKFKLRNAIKGYGRTEV